MYGAILCLEVRELHLLYVYIYFYFKISKNCNISYQIRADGTQRDWWCMQ